MCHPKLNGGDIQSRPIRSTWQFYLPPYDVADFRLMQSHEWLLTDEIIKTRNIGPGDNVYAVGLFSLAIGRERNIPIVRTGHIAIMSKEKIPGIRIGDWRGEAEVYVVEARSIGGLSGSPVFCSRNRLMRQSKLAKTGKMLSCMALATRICWDLFMVIG